MRRAWIMGAVVLGSAAVGGCTSSSSGGPSSAPSQPSSAAGAQTSTVHTTVTAVPPSTSSSSSASSTSSSLSRSSSSPAGTADCADTQLAVRVHPAGGGDSHGGVVAVFTNHSASACRLYGYPGAADVNAAGRQIEQAKRTLTGYLGGCRCTTPAPLRLGPGASASALIEGTNADAKGDAACLRGRSILVTPPNTRTSTTASFSGYSCDFQVHPVVAGRSGSK